MVGRNAALDGVRKQSRQTELPPEETISDVDDVETPMAERLDGSQYRDDILRLMFICCHPDLRPASRSRWRCGSSRASRYARSPKPSWWARRRWSSGSRGPRRASPGPTYPSRRRDPSERAERLAAVAAMVYLVFNEGYSSRSGEAELRAPLCEEAIRLARLLQRLFQNEPEIMGLAALLLLQHAPHRRPLRRRGRDRPAGRPGPQPVEPRHDRRGPGPDGQGPAPPPAGALSGAGRDSRPARPRAPGGPHRLAADRGALRQPGDHAALAGGDAHPRRGREQGRGVRRRRWR